MKSEIENDMVKGDEQTNIRFDPSYFVALLKEHYPDFRNFEMSLRGAGERFFGLAEHEVLTTGEDGYAILYIFRKEEDGLFHCIPYTDGQPEMGETWKLRVETSDYRIKERILGKIKVEDLAAAVQAIPQNSTVIEMRLQKSRLFIHALNGGDVSSLCIFRKQENGVFEKDLTHE